jgi:hypothetical protein
VYDTHGGKDSTRKKEGEAQAQDASFFEAEETECES